MSTILVIGGGAAGMMAAVAAAAAGAEVHLFEKNEKTGKKIYITGKGRCNLTNASDMQNLFENIISNSKFLFSSFNEFTNYDVMDFFEKLGLKLKIERGNRVFPVSDHSSDVIKTLNNAMKKYGVIVHLNTEINSVNCVGGVFKSIETQSGEVFKADACIIATGGLSYPVTGSTGDGYRFAKLNGHSITRLLPSLVSLHIKGDFISKLEGLSLKNIGLKITAGEPVCNKTEIEKRKVPKKGKLLYDGFGELLFTHFGISGPLSLAASAVIADYADIINMTAHIDLKPALTYEQLDTRLLRDFTDMSNKQFKNSLDALLPQKIIPVIVEKSLIKPDKLVNSVTKEEREFLCEVLKDFTMEIKNLGGYNEAVITKGGVNVKEINPKTMESKFNKGLYFAGEVLDLDAMTGGYNLQIAWSTGHTAGKSAAEQVLC